MAKMTAPNHVGGSEIEIELGVDTLLQGLCVNGSMIVADEMAFVVADK
jgi:hypothetical protein